MSRWRASGIHLLLSALVGVAVLMLLFFIWYPGPLFRATGGEKLVLLIVGIDIIAGPLLTLLVFDTKKKSIKFDLAVIGLIQAGFLAYGMHTMTVSRPAFIAFAVDRYSVVPASGIEEEDLQAATLPEYRMISWTGPQFVYAQMPSDNAEQMAIVDSAIAGKDIDYFPKYYQPHDQHTDEIVGRSWPVSLIKGLDPKIDEQLIQLEQEHGADQIGFLPLRTKLVEMTIVIAKSDASPLAYLDFDPWGTIQGEMIRQRESKALDETNANRPSAVGSEQDEAAAADSAAPMQPDSESGG